MEITTSKTEIEHLLKAWAAISLAFTILLRGENILFTFILSAITVGLAFLLHELAHKVVAQYYGLKAEFRADNKMLMIAIFTAFLGIIFAAPGAVYINGPAGVNRNGKISAAGPLTNLVLATLFLVGGLIFVNAQTPFYADIFSYGHMINSWIGLFNLIPFGMFDGSKILRWDKRIYGAMVVAAIVLMIL